MTSGRDEEANDRKRAYREEEDEDAMETWT